MRLRLTFCDAVGRRFTAEENPKALPLNSS